MNFFRSLLIALGLSCVGLAAQAANCSSFPYTLTNGTTADANQVMANFNNVLNCANAALAPSASPAFTGTVAMPDGSTWSSSGLILNGGLTATGQTITGGTFSGATISGGILSGVTTVTLGGIDETFATIASATTTNIGAALANYLQVTGTTTITAFDTVQAGTERTLEFQGALILTNSSALILPGGANITTAAGDTAIFRSEGSGNWRCISYVPATGTAIIGPPTGNYFSALKIVNDSTTANTKVDLSATEVVLTNASGLAQRCTAFSAVIDLTTGTVTSAANGMDGEARATSGWDYIYGIGIGNGTACAGLASASPSAPTLPAGYTFTERLGAVRLDASQNLYCTLQSGRSVQYMVTSGAGTCNGGTHSTTNTVNLPIVASGSAGSPTTPTWVGITVKGNGNDAAPATAAKISISVANTASGGSTIAAPNANYGGQASTSNPPPVLAFSSGSALAIVYAQFILEGASIDWASTGGSAAFIAVLGYEDNL